MEWKDLRHYMEIECYWHFNSTSFEFMWKRGRVHCLLGGGKVFHPNDGLGKCILVPHRMDEVRLPQQDKLVQEGTPGEAI